MPASKKVSRMRVRLANLAKKPSSNSADSASAVTTAQIDRLFNLLDKLSEHERTQVLQTPASTRGEPALLLAAKHKSLAVLERIVDAGCPIDLADHLGRTALHIAASQNDLATVQKLLQKGANPNAVAAGAGAQTPLHVTVANTTWYARQQNSCYASVIAELIRAGADINATDKYGKTPLDYAIQTGLPVKAGKVSQVVKTLLDAGAKASAQSWAIALCAAIRAGSVEAMQAVRDLAMKQGADPIGVSCSTLEGRGLLPVHVGIRLKKWHAVRELLAMGANINARTQSGDSALHLIIDRLQIEDVEQLVSFGVDINAMSEADGKTVLHRLARMRRPDLFFDIVSRFRCDLDVSRPVGRMHAERRLLCCAGCSNVETAA